MRPVGEWLTREELYDLVWARPMSRVAPEFRISNVGLAKICRRADVPFPPRGYWAKKHAGLNTEQAALPPGIPGQKANIRWPGDDDVDDALESYGLFDGPRPAAKDEELPPRPTFPNDLKQRLKACRELVGQVTVNATGARTHAEIKRVRAEDRARRDAQWQSGQEHLGGPRFSSRTARRRLQLVNAVFLALERSGAHAEILDDGASSLRVVVDGQPVLLFLERQQVARDLPYAATENMLAFKLKDRTGKGESRKIWNERREPLESQLSDVVVNVLLAGENNRREALAAAHSSLVQERQARVWEEERQKKREAALRFEKLEQDAAAFRRAADIRALVAATRDMHPRTVANDAWCAWALGEADRLDPVVNGNVFDGPDPDAVHRFSSW